MICSYLCANSRSNHKKSIEVRLEGTWRIRLVSFDGSKWIMPLFVLRWLDYFGLPTNACAMR